MKDIKELAQRSWKSTNKEDRAFALVCASHYLWGSDDPSDQINFDEIEHQEAHVLWKIREGLKRFQSSKDLPELDLKVFKTDKDGSFQSWTPVDQRRPVSLVETPKFIGFTKDSRIRRPVSGVKTAQFVGFTEDGGVRAKVDGDVISFKLQAYQPNFATNKSRMLGVVAVFI